MGFSPGLLLVLPNIVFSHPVHLYRESKRLQPLKSPGGVGFGRAKMTGTSRNESHCCRNRNNRNEALQEEAGGVDLGHESIAGVKLRWPKSGWGQAGTAFLGAAISSVAVFIWVNNTHFALYTREYPYDGQDGLSAFMDALQAGFWTLIGVFTLAFFIQRLITTKISE